MNIQAILNDKKLTNGEIQKKYNLTRSQQFAICFCSDGLAIDTIEQRVKLVNDGMSPSEIRQVMNSALK